MTLIANLELYNVVYFVTGEDQGHGPKVQGTTKRDIEAGIEIEKGIGIENKTTKLSNALVQVSQDTFNR